jgi:hypothetical protein
MLKKWFFTFGLVGILAALSVPLYLRITGRFMPSRILYLICPPAVVALSDPSNWWDQAGMWVIVLVGNAVLYGGLAVLLRLSVDPEGRKR